MACNNPHRVHLVKDMNHPNTHNVNNLTGEITYKYPKKHIHGSDTVVDIHTKKLISDFDELPSENQIEFYKYQMYLEHELPKNVTEISLPCGKCLACQHSKATTWATRIMHECSMHEHNHFITLTFDDYHLENKNKPYSIDLDEIQRFIKRLRKKIKTKFKVYYCGEYGDTTGRAHYHLGLMNCDFPDKTIYKQNLDGTQKEYNSELLNKAWQNFGHAHILELNFGTAYYLASYLAKKINRSLNSKDYKNIAEIEEKFGLKLSSKFHNSLQASPKSVPAQLVDDHYNKIIGTNTIMQDIEFAYMSRKPGIGYTWYQKYKKDLFKGFIVSNGHKLAIPKYYMRLLKEDFPEQYDKIAQKRFEQICHTKYETLETTQERMNVKEKLLQMKIDSKARDSY